MVKLHLKVVFDVNAAYLTVDIIFFILNSSMNCSEYMRIPAKYLPAGIVEQYQLKFLNVNMYYMVEIRKGIYGLPQAGIITNKRLQAHLYRHGYFPCPHTLGLYKYKSLDTTFTFVVDNFGIRYTSKANALHLIHCLRSLYIVTIDWSGFLYIGINLD